jgi:hypothetical protein
MLYARLLGIARPEAIAFQLAVSGRFDKQHVGAEIAEHHRTEGARGQAGEIENLDSFERLHDVPFA